MFRRKAPDMLPMLDALLHQAQAQVAPAATAEQQARGVLWWTLCTRCPHRGRGARLRSRLSRDARSGASTAQYPAWGSALQGRDTWRLPGLAASTVDSYVTGNEPLLTAESLNRG